MRPVPTPTGAAIYAAAILGVTLTFATAGLLAAQVMPTRSAAVGVTVGFLFVCLCCFGCSPTAPQDWRGWRWTTPFGLTARAAPYADNRVVPLLVLAAFPIAFATAGLVDGAPSRCGRRPGRGGDEPSTPHPVAGVRHRFRDTARGSADDGVGERQSSPTSC